MYKLKGGLYMLKKVAGKNSFANIRMGALTTALKNGGTIRIYSSNHTTIEVRVENKDGDLLGAGIHSRLLSALERANDSYESHSNKNLMVRNYCLKSEKEQLLTDISILKGATIVIKKISSNMLLLKMTNPSKKPRFKSGLSLESVLDSTEKTLKGF